MRFDFRNPAIAGTTMTERYRAGLDMAEWADRLGFVSLVLSEHHGSPDGYLPSPLVMAAAMAARTKAIRFMISAIVAPLHDPLRLAEDVAVVDLVSGGRLDLVLANGYVADEFAMFGVPLSERASRVTSAVETLRSAWTGQPFEHRGRPALVTPAPERDGPKLTLGGSTAAAARRAARIGDGFSPSMPDVWDHYREARIGAGNPDPGPYFGVSLGDFFLADDVEQGWADVGQYFLHETNAYGKWMTDAGLPGKYEPAADVHEMRSRGMYRVITPDEMVAELTASSPFSFALFHPMVGGIPPTLAWRSLELFEHEVLPRLTSGA